MSDATIRPFDVGRLYQVLDRRRNELGMSWRAVADQIWEQSSSLNERRRDHPISPSTLTNMATNPRATCQHALFILRWLNRTPESFLVGATGEDPDDALPAAGPDRRLRWNLRQLYGVLDERRRAEGLTWRSVAGLIDCTPSQLTGLRTAKFAINIDLAMRIVQWTDRRAADFVYPARW